MEYTVPGLNNINQKVRNLSRPKKAKMLVVDDEPDNLDLLYRTFRREFNVLKAESGVQALEILEAEGEVAVIISDQRMPEMKGTEFLSRTVPEFPDTVRIILTGFTDVEDLVEAINAGQVYKYITKPWDPDELKVVVHRAAETYEVLKQRTEELRRSQAQTALLAKLLQIAQAATTFEGSLESMVQAFAETFNADHGAFRLLDAGQVQTIASDEFSQDWLEQDPLILATIETSQMQGCFDVSVDETLVSLPQYGSLKAHIVVPIVMRTADVAMLSLQWESPYQLREDEMVLLHLAAQQVGLAIMSSRSYALAGSV
ncbi:response regulator [filamentous cyanobacterium LEGE 11480]|uniref:Response regulator n=1 Tax=Romeriopsis navalis LEGE 11480 TaxID=2777977 RepID=A0A928VS48_9CYAN|nr:response regulator [Romeriopsis navalis]MBE9031552.1 response regulator [Romeriopsis navalis LEGE 11480]